MKRFIALILCVVLSLGVLVPAALAAPASTNNETVTVFPDGSYCVTTITTRDSDISLYAVRTKLGSKTSNYYDALDNLLFTVTVHGSFEYNGTSSVATDSSYSYTIYSSNWSLENISAGYSGATAYVNGSFKYIFSHRTAYVSLSCSPNGELS